jgi:chromosome segregation ATPase
LADKAEAVSKQIAEQYQAAITAAWVIAEHRAALRLGEEVTAAQAAAAAARLAQSEANDAVAVAESAMVALRADHDRLASSVEAMAKAEARAIGERDALIGQLAVARRDLTAAERRAAAAEAVREAAGASVSKAQADARAAMAAATAMREQIAAEVATVRAEAAAAEATKRAATAETLELKAQIADLRRALVEARELARQAGTTPAKQRLRRSETRSAIAATLQGLPVAQPPTQPREDLPVVDDRLQLPKPERDAFDDGLKAGRQGCEEKIPRRFRDGQPLANLLPYRRAGYRDGLATRQAQPVLSANPEARAADVPCALGETASSPA